MLAGIKEKPIDFSNSLINNPQNIIELKGVNYAIHINRTRI